jgi:GT2 family glycosyltransferase
MEDHASAIACGGLLTFPDGRLQTSAAKRLTLWAVFLEQTFLERFFGGYWIRPFRGEPMRVPQVMGACLMMRRLPTGYFAEFDERFFLYCEDTELCARLNGHGSIWYVPKAEFVHDLGTSSDDSRWEAVANYNRGKELYFEIRSGKAAALACLTINRLGALIRIAGWTLAVPLTPFSHKARSKVALFWKVLTAPFRTSR